MEKKLWTIVILLVVFVFGGVGCTNLEQKEQNKTEFHLNDKAVIDHFEVTLDDIQESSYFQDVTSQNGTYLNLEFKIVNQSKEEQVIRPSGFQFITSNLDKTYVDLNHTKDIKMAPGETIMYKVVYDVPEQDSYAVYFYSGVVSNNIKFVTK